MSPNRKNSSKPPTPTAAPKHKGLVIPPEALFNKIYENLNTAENRKIAQEDLKALKTHFDGIIKHWNSFQTKIKENEKIKKERKIR